MKLLLDEMWRHAIAIELRRRGHDVIAVSERSDLRGQADRAILATAQAEGRVVLTENTADFRRYANEFLERGQAHVGLIFTTNNRYSRHDPRTTGRIITALDTLLSMNPDLVNLEHWLE